MSRLLSKDFSSQTLKLSRDLIGKRLIFGPFQGIITETEAYIGQSDPACHAARGLTNRTAIMFGPPGFTYVYLIYGMYHCLNIVSEPEGFPAATLIRGVYQEKPEPLYLNGPGKLCRHWGITRAHNGLDLTTHSSFWVEDTDLYPTDIQETPRIGIKVATDRLWRFIVDYKSLINNIDVR